MSKSGKRPETRFPIVFCHHRQSYFPNPVKGGSYESTHGT
jgi:hypothetical protein